MSEGEIEDFWEKKRRQKKNNNKKILAPSLAIKYVLVLVEKDLQTGELSEPRVSTVSST